MNIPLVFFAITAILQPISQIMEKYGLRQIGGIASFKQLLSLHTLLQFATNPFIIGGVLMSAASLVFWLAALSNLKVSYMYPLGSITYVVIAILAFFFLNEPITVTRWIGIVVIAVGCYLLNV